MLIFQGVNFAVFFRQDKKDSAENVFFCKKYVFTVMGYKMQKYLLSPKTKKHPVDGSEIRKTISILLLSRLEGMSPKKSWPQPQNNKQLPQKIRNYTLHELLNMIFHNKPQHVLNLLFWYGLFVGSSIRSH